ncbi:MAG: sodium transporter, partial [Planctomycetaceae bacterium]|nr:sodium transporter [Planctomycetaceae bacterium]
TLISSLLPSGLRGMFVAAFLAALMSSVDSYLNSSATIFTNDFYQRFFQSQADGRELLVVGRAITVVLLSWAIVFAFYLTNKDQGIYAIFQTMMSIFQGPALAVLMAGLLWKRATGIAALSGFLSGVGTAIFLYLATWESVLNHLGWDPLFQVEEPFLYFSVWAFVVSITVVIGGSLITSPEPEEKQAYVIHGQPKEHSS